MVEYEYISSRGANLDNKINIKKIIGKQVLSKGGTIVGRISELRINSDTLELEGLVIEGPFRKPVYIGKSYFSHLSEKAVILNIELSILIVGKKVITLDGKVLGKVKEVNRKGTTNEVESFVVRSLWRKYLIPQSDVKQIKSSVLINHKHETAKNHLWKRLKQNNNL